MKQNKEAEKEAEKYTGVSNTAQRSRGNQESRIATNSKITGKLNTATEE